MIKTNAKYYCLVMFLKHVLLMSHKNCLLVVKTCFRTTKATYDVGNLCRSNRSGIRLRRRRGHINHNYSPSFYYLDDNSIGNESKRCCNNLYTLICTTFLPAWYPIMGLNKIKRPLTIKCNRLYVLKSWHMINITKKIFIKLEIQFDIG